MEKQCLTYILYLIVFMCVQSCTPHLAPDVISDSIKGKQAHSTLFIADSQIHNIYGFRLKQMSKVSDLISKVAVRPPELNLLAPLVLEHLVRTSTRKNKSNLIVVLGDTTNIACSSEYDDFFEALGKGNENKLPVLMAHGNHDSYLLGTTNHYIPSDDVSAWKPQRMSLSALPTDENWWGNPAKGAFLNDNSWRGGCFQPAGVGKAQSSPMNKSRWLARYIDRLKDSGLTALKNNKNYPLDAEKSAIQFSAIPNSHLGKLNFSANGFWYRPNLGSVPSSSDLISVYKSFLVQKIEVDQTRMVIIDTSVCERTRGGWRFFTTNAGHNGCIGAAQFKVIERYVRETPDDHKLVIAGHFPLSHLAKVERSQLLNIMSTQKDWTYLSAHAHRPISKQVWKTGIEINMGSTTDWPMESNNLWFRSGGSSPAVDTTRLGGGRLPFYIPSIFRGKSEICRHLATAKALAVFDDYASIRWWWRSPLAKPACNPSGDNWDAIGNALAGYVDVIYQRFGADAEYRNAILKIAASASRSEFLKYDLIGSN